MSTWQPLSVRGRGVAVSETLYEGLPPHLRAPVLHWFECQFDDSSFEPDLSFRLSLNHEAMEARALRIANRLRWKLERTGEGGVFGASYFKAILAMSRNADDMQMLDLVDAALAERNDPAAINWGRDGKRSGVPNTPEDLNVILLDGGSAYQVNDSGSGLERRVPEVVKEAARSASESSAASRTHLEAAWAAAYGRRPEPTVAYAEAVKAIEAAIIPLVLPNDPQATLGKALAHLRNNPDLWQLSILDSKGDPAEIEPLVGLLRLVWQGQRDRHAGTRTAIAVTPEAAETAVHAAAMIVYWLSRSGLQRRP